MGRNATCRRMPVAHRKRRLFPAFVLFTLAGLSGIACVAMAGNSQVTLLHSDETRVRFALEDLKPSWRLHTVHKVAGELYEVRIPGFVNSGIPGFPALPRRGGWVLVPPGTRPVLTTIASEWSRTESHRLLPEPTPVIRRDPETGEAYPADEIILPGEEPRAGGTIPRDVVQQLQSLGTAAVVEAVVNLGPVVPWRGRRIVSYSITPLQNDAGGRATRILKKGTWEIRFVPDAQAGGEPSIRGSLQKRTPHGDDKFSFLFLNGNLMSRLPPEAASGVVPALDKTSPDYWRRDFETAFITRSIDPLVPEIKIPIKRTQLYRVAVSELRNRGLLPATPVQESQLVLYQRRYLPELANASPPFVEVEVPIHIVGEGDEFTGEDFFLFYGLRLRDDGPFTYQSYDIPGSEDPEETYNEYNIYWLAVADPAGGETWARMDSVSFTAAGGSLVPSYRRVDYVENDNHYREHVEDINSDRNHWNSPFLDEFDATATIYAAHPDSANARLRLGIRGYSNAPATSNRWVDIFLVNAADTDSLLGSINARNVFQQIFTADLTGAHLQELTLDVRLRPQGTFPRLNAFLDWLEVSYDALYTAQIDLLLFHGGDEVGTREIEVTGFTSSSVGLVEVTDPHQPVWIPLSGNNLRDGGNGTTTLSIQVLQPSGRRTFFAQADMTSDGVPEILYFRATTVPSGQDPTEVNGSDPDLVVITHADFRSGIDRWVSHRQSRAAGGLNVHVVEAEQLFNWYSGGLKSPEAIARFTDHAVDEWGSWALQLVGDANENVRGLGLAAQSSRYYTEPTDWLPTHLHVQNLGSGYQPELLMSDKWYAYPEAIRTGNYPGSVVSPTQMYVGRFPCNSLADLNVFIDKIVVYEPAQPGQSWRRRGIFLADDAWSYGYRDTTDYTTMEYKAYEREFQTSEDSMATWWDEAGLEPVRLFLAETLDPYVPPGAQYRNTREFRDIAYSEFYPLQMSAFNQGATLIHYQGHANMRVLAHEYMLRDQSVSPPLGRQDVNDMYNTDKPWVFFGMGCHISDWGQNTVLATTVVEPSLAEKFLLRPQAGAIATYASSGYEFLSDNKKFSETTLERWLRNPPTVGVNGGEVRSRWMLGELMWASEADLLSPIPYERYGKVVGQYCLLGDPLLMLDCEPPEVTATLRDAGGEVLNDQDELIALTASNIRLLQFDSQDVAGIHRLEIIPSDMAPFNVQVSESIPGGTTTHQVVTYEVDLPIRPLDHTIVFHVYDTANFQAGDSHYQLTVTVPQTAEFTYENGDPAPLGEIPFPPDVPVTLRAVVQSAADLTPYPADQLALSGSNLDLTNVLLEHRTGQAHVLDVTFTATATPGTEAPRSVILSIGGYDTEYVLQEGYVPPPNTSISQLYAFPNPMRDQTRFVFETGTVASGRIQIFTVAGRQVDEVAVAASDFSGEGAVVPWNGRDEAGDPLANGVYFFRVELDSPDGKVASEMQRLVVMR